MAPSGFSLPQEFVYGVGLAARVPGGPYLRAFDTNGGSEQGEAAMAKRLRLFDPGDLEALQALDALRRVILHADEDDEAVAWRLYAVVEDAEQRPDTEGFDLLLDEALGGLREGALDLTDADGCGSWLQDAVFDEDFGEEVDLAAAPASVCALVAGWREERLEDARCSDVELVAFKRLGIASIGYALCVGWVYDVRMTASMMSGVWIACDGCGLCRPRDRQDFLDAVRCLRFAPGRACICEAVYFRHACDQLH